MMEDDVANSKENPFPGKLFNKPTAVGQHRVDVYAGCTPDYKGSVVTAQLLLDVLTGNSAGVAGKGNGKVLKSTSADKVFINFADHGGSQIVEMPHGPYLKASDLNSALKTMHTKGMYDKLVFYMEACNGGSMFANLLPKDIGIFATTAANPNEPSWGTYCPPHDIVDGTRIGSCLGDLYSVNWMEDSDAVAGLDQTLEEQFEQVVRLTNKSHPIEYGDQSFKTINEAKDFLAPSSSMLSSSIQPSSMQSSSAHSGATAASQAAALELKLVSAVDTRDIELVQQFYLYLRASDAERKSGGLGVKLSALVAGRELADARFRTMIQTVQGTSPLVEAIEPAVDTDKYMQCAELVTASVERHCGRFTSYSMKYHHQVGIQLACCPSLLSHILVLVLLLWLLLLLVVAVVGGCTGGWVVPHPHRPADRDRFRAGLRFDNWHCCGLISTCCNSVCVVHSTGSRWYPHPAVP
jgi:legumain